MIKSKKKILLGAMATIAIAAPIVAVASCSNQKFTGVKIMEKFNITINKESVKKDGWTFKKDEGWKQAITEYKEDKKTKSKLSNEFVDYLVEKMNKVDLTKEYTIAFIDLGGFGIHKLGDYFWDEFKDIKINKTKYAKQYNKKIDYNFIGSSGIFLNLRDNYMDVVQDVLHGLRYSPSRDTLRKHIFEGGMFWATHYVISLDYSYYGFEPKARKRLWTIMNRIKNTPAIGGVSFIANKPQGKKEAVFGVMRGDESGYRPFNFFRNEKIKDDANRHTLVQIKPLYKEVYGGDDFENSIFRKYEY